MKRMKSRTPFLQDSSKTSNIWTSKLDLLERTLLGYYEKYQAWETAEGSDVVLIRNPTVSNLSHRLLNPFIYRNIHTDGTLDDLASLLDTPAYCEVRYNQVVADGRIIRKLNRFSALADDAAEATIQSQFIGLVEGIADRLGVDLVSDSETKIIVGGILA